MKNDNVAHHDPAHLVGPMRKVLREDPMGPDEDGVYRFRYFLKCGHIVERARGGRTRCACSWCKKP